VSPKRRQHSGDFFPRIPQPRPPRRPGRAALICGLIAGLLLILWSVLEQRACADEFVALVGIGATAGMGEQGLAPEAALTYASRHVAVEGYWYGAAKLESGAGWGARGAAEARWRGLGAGLAYSYRDGGAWVKQFPWARVSAGAGQVRVIGEVALGSYNRERKVEVRVTARSRRVVMEPRFFVTRHLQGVGWGAALFVGLAHGGNR
jgi:hypothetical protein